MATISYMSERLELRNGLRLRWAANMGLGLRPWNCSRVDDDHDTEGYIVVCDRYVPAPSAGIDMKMVKQQAVVHVPPHLGFMASVAYVETKLAMSHGC